MKLKTLLFSSLMLLFFSRIQSQEVEPFVLSKDHRVSVEAINHGTMKLLIEDKVIYIDPYGDKMITGERPKADLVLITDIHQDHYSPKKLKLVIGEKTLIIVPQAVFDLMPEEYKAISVVLNNDSSKTIGDLGVRVTAIPMYNMDPAKLSFHTKGRGNGYLIDIKEFRIYISGDTEDVPEMRALKNVDVAFICMNEPYTMSEEKAASAVMEFKPILVIPFHYRNADKSFSDVTAFSTKVEAAGINCTLLNWY